MSSAVVTVSDQIRQSLQVTGPTKNKFQVYNLIFPPYKRFNIVITF